MANVDAEKAKGKAKRKPKLTNKERHKRFVDMAHEVEADESPETFDRAFQKIVRLKTRESSSG
jgi:hypothetical protein